MSKADKIEQARREGMAYALRIVKKGGREELEKELKWRNATGTPLGLNKSACEEYQMKVKYNTIDTLTILSCMTLRDEFDFGPKRLERFRARFMKKAECIMDDYTTWQDQIDALREECGMHFSIRKNDMDVRN